LIFALCRYGGLRCPSEILTLTWADVNWDQARILVHSPKTERHEGGESRLIPLFPELAPYLQEVFDEAEPGTEHVITRYRQANSNLRTQFKRIIHKAGLKPWPRLFQNLRSTRETELTESFPLHVVTAWIGNSQLVARKHYLQVTDEHFARAAQNAAHLAQKEAQQASAVARIGPHENRSDAPENAEIAVFSGAEGESENGGVGDEGIEPSTAALRVRCSAS
jgi:integrase